MNIKELAKGYGVFLAMWILTVHIAKPVADKAMPKQADGSVFKLLG